MHKDILPHILINEDIGFSLAELAKESYGVTKLAKDKDEVYAAAHKEYFKRNWSNMLGMRKGVLRAFGLPEDDNEHDGRSTPTILFFITKQITKHTSFLSSLQLQCSRLISPT